jgi:hypothetical protein
MSAATVSPLDANLSASPLDGDRTLFSCSVPDAEIPTERLTETHRRVFEYWQAKRGANRVARRTDIDPCDLGPVLPHLILWETDGLPDYRVRLAGTEICTNMLGELKGTLLGELRCPLLAEARREFDAVHDQGYVSLAERTLHWLGRPLVFYRHLLLPLTDGNDRIHMMLSVMTFEDTEDWNRFLYAQGHRPPEDRWLSGAP